MEEFQITGYIVTAINLGDVLKKSIDSFLIDIDYPFLKSAFFSKPNVFRDTSIVTFGVHFKIKESNLDEFYNYYLKLLNNSCCFQSKIFVERESSDKIISIDYLLNFNRIKNQEHIKEKNDWKIFKTLLVENNGEDDARW